MSAPTVTDALRRRAEQGDTAAMRTLHAQLVTSRRTREEALSWLRRAGRAGDREAVRTLGRDLRGEEGFDWRALDVVLTRGRGVAPLPDDVAAAAAGLGAHELTFDDDFGDGRRRRSARRASRWPQVWVFDGGLVARDRRRGTVEVYPWDRGSVHHEVTRIVDAFGTWDDTELRYVVGNGSEELWLSGRLRSHAQVRVLGDLVVRRRTAVGVPAALDALRSAHRLHFGPFLLDAHGVHGRRSAGWSEVTGVRVDRLGFAVSDRAGDVVRAPVLSVRDLHTAQRVIDTLRR